MPFDYYNTAENLTGTMIEFGTYTLKYLPPDGSSVDHSIELSISSEANLQQMLEFFESFLRAAGYEFEGKELCLERSAPDFSDLPEKWGFSDVSANSVVGGDTVVFGSGLLGGAGNDVISFGTPQAAYNFETGAKTWDDVITFG